MLRVLCSIFLVLAAVDSAAAYNHFNGGTFSFSVRNDSNGVLVTDIDLITGWVLGKGPCGPGCNKTDLHRSTLDSRQATIKTLNDNLYFGNWTSEFKFNERTSTRELNSIISINMKEEVLAMNMRAKWEEEWLQVTVPLETRNKDITEDIYFEGHNWHNLTLQSQASQWKLQAKIDSRIRSDTKKPNQSPKVLMKPFYRIKLNTIGRINIAATDPDDDFVICSPAVASEALDIAVHTLSGLTLLENCTVIINTSSALGYHDDSWGAVALSVGDHNKKKITMGEETLRPYESSSLSKTAVQFLVQVLAVLHAPEFVNPTADQNHHFILYAGTTWVQNIYAKASENATIDQFIVIGRQREQLVQSDIQDGVESRVRFIELKWTPKDDEVGNHIICISAVDNTGVDAEEDRCFTVEIRPDRFNHTTTVTLDRPYFVDLPAFEQTIQCLRDVTCTLPIYVVSSEPVDKISIPQSYFKTTYFGPISNETHNGQLVYKSDLSFRDSVDGTKKICLIAHNTAGKNSDETCIQSMLNPPDPCASNPCKNSAECVRSVKDPLAYFCKCLNDGYSGKLCQWQRDQCQPNPCVHGEMCLKIIPDFACMCNTTIYSGQRCQIEEDKCTSHSCGGHGVCKTNSGRYECKCFDRYSGTNCETDLCAGAPGDQLTCNSSCSCNGHGVCGVGSTCLCSVGYTGNTCDTAAGNAEKVYNVIGTKFVPPSPDRASTIRCYIGKSCSFSVFASTSQSKLPTITVDVPTEIMNSRVDTVSEVHYIPGLQHLYTAEVHVNGGTKVGTSYMCLDADAGGATDRLCVQISYETDPVDDAVTIEAHEQNATYKFISPTPNSESNFICNLNEDCRMILHTNLITQCEQVVSADRNVTVFPTQLNAGSCVTEAVFKFRDEGNVRMCFKSTIKPSSQTRCFYIDVFNKASMPCVLTPCQNDGDCLLSSRTTSYCLCKTGYTGGKCEKGKCQPSDNNCDPGAFCYHDETGPQCICPLGMTGSDCKSRSPSAIHGSKFTDTAVPSKVTCIVNRPCTIPLGISTNQTSTGASLSFGFVSPHVRKAGIATEPSLTGSLKATVSVIPLEVGQKTVCVQTYAGGVNDDELCIQVQVTQDSTSLYGFHDRPSFIMPSLPANAEVKCPADKPCHVIYHVTPGEGHSKDCTAVLFSKAPYEHRYVFSSCSNCTEGIGSLNCSLDVSFIPPASEVGKSKEVCLEVQLARTHLKGEERCFKVTVANQATLNTKTGCQKIHCNNGGFCDASDVNNPICYCRPGYTGNHCDTKIFGTGTPPPKGSFINNFGVPKTLTCHVNAPCPVNFHMTGPTNPSPKFSLGYTSPGLTVTNQPTTYAQNGTEYTGTTAVTPTQPGTHKVCVQTGHSGTVDDEMCLTINVGENPAPNIEKSKPHYVDPTPAADTTFLCKTGVACYIDVHFIDNADPIQSGEICPSVDDTSPTYTAGVHIFEPVLHQSTCTATISYVPPSSANGQQKTVCTQILLPGKQGEERCFHIEVKSDIKQSVVAPCKDKSCQNGGKCVADLTSVTPTAVCVCPHGKEGEHCNTDVSTPVNLPGVQPDPTTLATSHFDGKSAIPTNISCIINQPCKIPIPYKGTDPPVLGYVDPVLTPGTPEVVHGIAVTEVTSATAGPHKLCMQTTATGSTDGENVDEVCVTVTTSQGPAATVNKTAPYFKPETISENSTVVCNINSNCHVPLHTQPMNGSCPQVSECPPGVSGVHVFDTKLVSGVCITDAAITTGASATTDDLCVSAGPGGEERHVAVDVKPLTGFGPCQKLHCKNGGKCVAALPIGTDKAVCVCTTGHEGDKCQTTITTPSNLPGAPTNTGTTTNTPHFDGNGAIPTEITCVKGEPCSITIPYKGTKPPKLGFVDPTIKAGTPKITTPGGNAVVTVTSNSTNTQKVCVQTTVDGDLNSENVDEICVNVKVSPGPSSPPDQNKPHFGKDAISNGSKVTCNVDTSCRIPLYTEPGPNGQCPQVTECPPGVSGMHVFPTELTNSKCYTEAVLRTGTSNTSESVCLSSGPGGEKRTVTVDVHQFTEFGPCQKLHCKNGGSCLPDNGGPVKCLCPELVSGNNCEVVSPCKGKICNHGTCVEKQSTGSSSVAECACQKGYEGADCNTGTTPTKPLPGVVSNLTTTPMTPYFDVHSAVPTKIECVANKPCQIPIHYHGPSNNPPILGYTDPLLHATKTTTVSGPGGGPPAAHTAVTTVSPTTPGTHRLCFQTTVDGTEHGVNLDEICTDIHVTSTAPPTPGPSQPHFEAPTLPGGSSVMCNKNSSCHIPIVTALSPSGNCSTVTQCSGTPVDGLHIFAAKVDNGKCVTDIVVKTGSSDKTDHLCITSGPGGETRTIDVETKEFKEFGPCQKLHCLNKGKCDSHSGTPVCVCPNLVNGTSCENVLPCKATTCANNGKCVQPHGAPSACACPKGYEGRDCSESTPPPTALIGVEGEMTPTALTPKFDGSNAIPIEIVCITGQPCTLSLPYTGESSKPPILGHIDPGVNNGSIIVTGGPNPGPHTMVTTFRPTSGGKVCIQTTLDGAPKGENIDEICVDVKVKPTGPSPPPPPPQTKPHFGDNHLPDESTVLCNLDTNCHIPVVTAKIGNSCEPVQECGTKNQNVQVFPTAEKNGECLTDVVVRAGMTEQTDKLCLSAGSGGEERHINVETKKITGFGPCQKLHCKNGGTCDGSHTPAVCHCPALFTGYNCEGTRNLTHQQSSATCDSKAKADHARSMVKSGRVSCKCIVKGKEVEVIKKNPAPTTKQTAMAAAYGAGGSTGVMAVGAVLYIVVNKLKQPKVHPRPKG